MIYCALVTYSIEARDEVTYNTLYSKRIQTRLSLVSVPEAFWRRVFVDGEK